MKIRRIILQALVITSSVSISLIASAQLYSRAGGTMIYDSDQNITWLANANYAASQTPTDCSDEILPGGVIDAKGGMDWYTAIEYVNTLEFGGYDDWRLPRALQPDVTCDNQSPVVDSFGFNCTGSEMGNLFYVGLGGQPGKSIADIHNENFVLFKNIEARTYWYENSWEIAPLIARNLHMDLGFQNANAKSVHLLVWPVRDGDVSDELYKSPINRKDHYKHSHNECMDKKIIIKTR